MFVAIIASLLVLSPTAFAIQFPGPAPTPAGDFLVANLNGFTPKPTSVGRVRSLPELFRRQTDDGVCGYLEGDGGMYSTDSWFPSYTNMYRRPSSFLYRRKLSLRL